MPSVNMVMPFRPAFDYNGLPIAGAQAYFTLAGTTTPTPVYTDAGLATPGTNPVVANSSGRFPQRFLDDEINYRMRIFAADANVLTDDALEDYDPYSPEVLTAIPLVGNQGEITTSAPVIDTQVEWNNAAVDFIGERRRIVGTAYGAGSVAFSYEFGGNRVFSWKPRGDLLIGNQTANPSSDYGMALARNLFDGLTGNTHGFNHADLIRRSGNLANASFDAQPRFQANNYDHHAGFQDRAIFQLNSGQTVTNVYGTYSHVSMDTGTITNRYGHYVTTPTLTSGGAITTQYGYYCESLTTGGTNWAYFSAGITPSKFGGPVTVGNQASASVDPGVLLSRNLNDGLTTNGHGFVCTTLFRRSGTVAYAAFDAFTTMEANSFDHFAGFQSRPKVLFASGGQTMNDLYGTYSYALIDTGTVTDLYHSYAAEPDLANGGAITRQYGFYAEALTNGGTNYAFYSAGTTPSNFGGRLTIGFYNAASTDAGVVVARDLFDGGTDNIHGYSHNDRIRRASGIANASFDAWPTYEAESYDHHAGFQDRANFQLNGGSTVNNVYGLYSYAQLDTGTITNRYGGYVAAPLLTNGGVITNQYGYYCEELTAGGTDWAFYSAGTTKSKFGGQIIVGGTTALPAGGSADVALLFGSAAGIGIYAGSGVPTISAGKGSQYLRSDGSGTSDRAYINTDGGTTWTALTTAA